MVLVAVRVRFRGRVQGVSFRYYAKRFADEYDVKGWIRNMDDGSVEAIMEGEEAAVMKVVELCRTGNPNASVTDVELRKMEYTGRYSGFVIR
jgi:acylphosphatase